MSVRHLLKTPLQFTSRVTAGFGRGKNSQGNCLEFNEFSAVHNNAGVVEAAIVVWGRSTYAACGCVLCCSAAEPECAQHAYTVRV